MESWTKAGVVATFIGTAATIISVLIALNIIEVADDVAEPVKRPTTVEREEPVATGAGSGSGDEHTQQGDGGHIVRVPAGEFTMGPNDGEENEKPVRQVYLDEYWIDSYEVTVADYRKCVDASGCTAPSMTSEYCSGDFEPLNNWGKSGRENHPVNCVDWGQADAYCVWAGKRLPTEAEWEKAARGTDGRIYPWGNEEPSCSFAVMGDGKTWDALGCGKMGTWDVASKPRGKSPYGAYDMAGNVWEWTADWYDSYQAGATRNPTGPSSGSYRVYRGGGFLNDGVSVRGASRGRSPPSDADGSIGLRCATSVP